jgi:amino acid adenylation domain-containing protein
MKPAIPLLQDFLEGSAARAPDKVAVIAGSRTATYAEIAARANALATTLARRGVARGDRVVVFAENDLEAVIAFWAALKANAIPTVVNAQTRSDKLAYYLADSRATALVTEAKLAPIFAPALARTTFLRTVVIAGERGAIDAPLIPGSVTFDDAVAEGLGAGAPARRCLDVDLAAIVYTSGSTGDPKGVMLTHRNMLTAATSVSTYLGYREDDVVLCLMPLAFDYGLYQMLMSARVGARLLLERGFAFPTTVLERVVAHRATVFPGVPTVFAMMAEMQTLEGYDLSRIRTVTNTAAALPVKHIRFLQRTFPNARIFSMYGLTECKRCTYLPPEDLDRKPTSVGIAIPNTELWVVDEHDRRLGPGEVGQLVIRGATVMRGYWEKPEATARKLRPGPLPGEQVLYTGDLCKLDEEGYLYFVARMDDVIKTRGEKVAPKEVENALVDVEGVREAAVIGVDDPILGQAVKAFVTLEQGAAITPEEIRKEVQRRLEPFAVPKLVVVVPELPKTTTGKIKKTDLR